MLFLILFSGFYGGLIKEIGFHKWNFYVREKNIWIAPRSELGYTVNNYGFQLGYRTAQKILNLDISLLGSLPNEHWLGMYDTDWLPDGEKIFFKSYSHNKSQFFKANISLQTGYKVLFVSSGIDLSLYSHKIRGLYYDVIWWEDVDQWEHDYDKIKVLTYDELALAWYWSIKTDFPIRDWLSLGGEYKFPIYTQKIGIDEHPLRGFSQKMNFIRNNHFESWSIWSTFRIHNFPVSIGYERIEHKYRGYGYVFNSVFWFTNEGSFNRYWLRIGY